EAGTAPGKYGAGAELAALPRILDLTRDEAQDLVEALLDDVRDQLAGDQPLRTRAGTRQLDAFARIDELRVRDAVLLLRLLGFRERDRQPLREIVRYHRTAPRYRREVAHLAVAEDCELGRRAAQIDERNADILFIVGHDCVRGR